MKQEIVNIKNINKSFLINEGYKYCLVYYLNDLIFGNIEDMPELNMDILVEGFFFNEEKELHVFEDDYSEEFKAVKTLNNDEDSFEEKFELKRRIGNKAIKNKYKKLKVVHHLDYEDDGQAYITYTSLKGVE